MTLFTQEKADPLLLLDRFCATDPAAAAACTRRRNIENYGLRSIKKNFENHRFHTSYFETKEEAAAYLSNQIKGEKVGFGGSITAKEMNLFEVLGKRQRSDLALGTGTGCKDQGERFHRIYP